MLFQGGRVLTRNFEDYQLPRFASLPNIEIVLVDNPQTSTLGGGEPPMIAMGAALANAVHDATGVRLLQLPMTAQRGKSALGSNYLASERPGAGGSPSAKAVTLSPGGLDQKPSPPDTTVTYCLLSRP